MVRYAIPVVKFPVTIGSASNPNLFTSCCNNCCYSDKLLHGLRCFFLISLPLSILGKERLGIAVLAPIPMSSPELKFLKKSGRILSISSPMILLSTCLSNLITAISCIVELKRCEMSKVEWYQY